MSWNKALGIIIGTVLFLFWVHIPEDEFEEFDDPYSVTFTYDCREVMTDEDVPEHVLEECKKIMKDNTNERTTI